MPKSFPSHLDSDETDFTETDDTETDNASIMSTPWVRSRSHTRRKEEFLSPPGAFPPDHHARPIHRSASAGRPVALMVDEDYDVRRARRSRSRLKPDDFYSSSDDETYYPPNRRRSIIREQQSELFKNDARHDLEIENLQQEISRLEREVKRRIDRYESRADARQDKEISKLQREIYLLEREMADNEEAYAAREPLPQSPPRLLKQEEDYYEDGLQEQLRRLRMEDFRRRVHEDEYEQEREYKMRKFSEDERIASEQAEIRHRLREEKLREMQKKADDEDERRQLWTEFQNEEARDRKEEEERKKHEAELKKIAVEEFKKKELEEKEESERQKAELKRLREQAIEDYKRQQEEAKEKAKEDKAKDEKLKREILEEHRLEEGRKTEEEKKKKEEKAAELRRELQQLGYADWQIDDIIKGNRKRHVEVQKVVKKEEDVPNRWIKVGFIPFLSLILLPVLTTSKDSPQISSSGNLHCL